MIRCARRGLAPLLSLLASGAVADGSSIDRIYDPYVQELEKEFEYRLLHTRDGDGAIDGSSVHKLAYGQAISDRLFAEVYLVGSDLPGDDLELSAYEAELKWQLSEQGELSNDWGLLFELEREREDSLWESSATLLLLHEWGRWVGTANFSLIYEWGDAIDNEFETALAAQLRYRLSPRVEPAIELFQSESTSAIGPLLRGVWRLGGGKALNWEVGAIAGIDAETPDLTWKLNLEYEFY